MVGAEGFEPPTLCSQSRCATRLRYAPTCVHVWLNVEYLFDCTVLELQTARGCPSFFGPCVKECQIGIHLYRRTCPPAISEIAHKTRERGAEKTAATAIASIIRNAQSRHV